MRTEQRKPQSTNVPLKVQKTKQEYFEKEKRCWDKVILFLSGVINDWGYTELACPSGYQRYLQEWISVAKTL